MTSDALRKLIARALILLAWLAIPQAGAAALKPVPPQPAPALVLPLVGGGQSDLARLRGQVVLVNFWATWCPPCRKEMPSMQRLSRRLAGQPFSLLAVNVGETEDLVAPFLRELGLSFPVPLDERGQRVKDWKAFVFPTSYLVDKAGRLRYALQGSIEWDTDEALEAIDKLLAE